MTISDAERTIRKALPITRFMMAYLPLPITRWIIGKINERTKLPMDITHEKVSADGVPCEWLIPERSEQNQVLLYLHGGGFVLGQTPAHLEIGAHLAQKMNTGILMVDYRLAPEYPFPAALDDCVTAYRWLLNQGYSADSITIAGDSAGGNLTITTLMKLRDSGNPLPIAAACLSPVADLTNKAEKFQEVHDDILHPKAAKFFNESYIADNDINNPLISPAFGDWHGLPPMLIHAGEDEILYADAVQIESLIREAGGTVQLKIYPRMWHVWQLNMQLPQAKQSLDEIAQFLTSHVNKAIV